ncbi:hypothetical protein LTR17_024040 [Elasticomyces elasticus]|nr:hypothetical protein LTR17_024040 [Elasticomyces elasticus]
MSSPTPFGERTSSATNSASHRQKRISNNTHAVYSKRRTKHKSQWNASVELSSSPRHNKTERLREKVAKMTQTDPVTRGGISIDEETATFGNAEGKRRARDAITSAAYSTVSRQ